MKHCLHEFSEYESFDTEVEPVQNLYNVKLGKKKKKKKVQNETGNSFNTAPGAEILFTVRGR